MVRRKNIPARPASDWSNETLTLVRAVPLSVTTPMPSGGGRVGHAQLRHDLQDSGDAHGRGEPHGALEFTTN